MTWTSEELTLISANEEIVLTVARERRVLRRGQRIWVVREGDDLYVRALGGPASGWYQDARTRRKGGIRAGGLRRNVAFTAADPDARDRIDAAYRNKYGHYAAAIIETVTGHQAASTTLRILPCSPQTPACSAVTARDVSGRRSRRGAPVEQGPPWQALFDRSRRQGENA